MKTRQFLQTITGTITALFVPILPVIGGDLGLGARERCRRKMLKLIEDPQWSATWILPSKRDDGLPCGCEIYLSQYWCSLWDPNPSYTSGERVGSSEVGVEQFMRFIEGLPQFKNWEIVEKLQRTKC